jgi:hypothetical protein
LPRRENSADSKIDVAYSLSIFDEEIHSDLRVIKDIRNIFAHPKGSFKGKIIDDQILLETVKKFQGYDMSIHPLQQCANRIAKCMLAISTDEDELKMAGNVLASPPFDIGQLQALGDAITQNNEPVGRAGVDAT